MILLFLLLVAKQAISQNFASSTAGSFIFQSSKNLTRPNSVITPKNNYYLLGKCERSFLTIKLAHSIRIKRIDILNNEWFANFATKIKISILIDDKFMSLGFFDLKIARTTNIIDINTQYFSSMLNIEFLEFYGKHNFFTLTSIQVYGTTLIDEFLDVCQKQIASKQQKKCIRDNRIDIVNITHENNANFKFVKLIFVTIVICQVIFLLYKCNILNI